MAEINDGWVELTTSDGVKPGDMIRLRRIHSEDSYTDIVGKISDVHEGDFIFEEIEGIFDPSLYEIWVLNPDRIKLNAVIALINNYAYYDGGHHKDWVFGKIMDTLGEPHEFDGTPP